MDRESEKLINKTIAKLSEDLVYRAFVGRIMEQAFRFFMDTPRPEILHELKQKMIKGAAEHGSPERNPTKLKQHIKEEFLDLLGWGSMLDEAGYSDQAPTQKVGTDSQPNLL